MKLITSIIATISLLSLATYDFLNILRIARKEQLVEKIWTRLAPNKQYDEKRVFLCIKPMLLHTWFLTFVLSGGVLGQFPAYNLFCLSAPLLSAVATMRTIRRNDEND